MHILGIVVVLGVLGGCLVLWLRKRPPSGQRAKAEQIFRIYKRLKLQNPAWTEDEFLRVTARRYFVLCGSSPDELERKSPQGDPGMLEGCKDIATLAHVILHWEGLDDPELAMDLVNLPNHFKEVKARMKMREESREKAVQEAYKRVFGTEPS